MAAFWLDLSCKQDNEQCVQIHSSNAKTVKYKLGNANEGKLGNNYN